MGDFENVKAAASLKEYAAQHLKPAPGRARDNYVCPKCKSGTGKNKSAAFYVLPDGRRCFCHVCHWQPDIYELAGYLNDTAEPLEQLRIVAEWARVPLSGGRDGAPRGFQAAMTAQAAKDKADGKDGKGAESMDESANDYSQGREKHRRYIAECARRLAEEPTPEILAYLSARGITHAEAVSLGLGYDPQPAHGWQDDKGEWHNTPRLVIPWQGSDYYHIDRAIDERARNLKYDKPPSNPTDKHPIGECVGAQPIYNPAAFEQGYIVVVEGALDAIAVQLCGYNAVALGGTAINDFVNEAAARNYSGVVIDMLDCDGHSGTDNPAQRKGRGAGADLVALSAEAGITALARLEYGVCEDDTYGGHKDAGEWLAADRADLAAMLNVMRGIALEKGKRTKEKEYREALRHLNVKDPAKVARDALELRDVYEPVPTGIKPLDEALDGGINLGELTIFGAISSYGKTTFAAQVCDNLASAGRTVLFATVEQGARELVSKSLARTMYLNGGEDANHITTPSEIMSLKERRKWNMFRNDDFAQAVAIYNREIAPRVKMLEGGDRPTVKDIRAVASMMAEHDGQAPIVFLDYLQLLAPLSERYDDKKNADVNVSELRKLARDLNTHVWCISSLNRSSYSGVISLDSFKESGGIEYGADLVLGLQPRDMEKKLRDVAETKRKREADKLMRDNKKKKERDCELVILKRRNGAMTEEPIPLSFNTLAAYFTEPTSERAAHQAQACDIDML